MITLNTAHRSFQSQRQLYGLYKCATVSITPNVAKPSIFDIYGKPKWEAWNNAGKTCEGSQEIAEQRYLALARQLGWSPSAQPPSTPKRNADTSANQQSQNDDDDIWDREDDKGKRAGGGGFSVSVSSVTAPPMADGEGVHALAVSGNVESLRDLLSKDASDINSVDEYVCLRDLTGSSLVRSHRPSQGYTPLHLAADRGHADIVRLLLDYRANVSAKVSSPRSSVCVVCAHHLTGRGRLHTIRSGNYCRASTYSDHLIRHKTASTFVTNRRRIRPRYHV